MEGKPLTRERLDLFHKVCTGECAVSTQAIGNVIEEALAAEQYWREAVKNANEFPSDSCAFCSDRMAQTEHKPDCPWVLAQ